MRCRRRKETSPRGLSLFLDWAHLASGSIWIGGLVGLLVLVAALPAGDRTLGLTAVVPRFSRTPGSVRFSGGALGRDNEQIFAALGLGLERLERLRTEQIV